MNCEWLADCGFVDAALPGYPFGNADVEVASDEEEDDDGEAEDGKGDLERREVGFCSAAVETPEDAGPHQPQKDALVGQGERIDERDHRDDDDEQEIQQAEEGEQDWGAEEEGEIFGPAFDEVGGGAVHVRGECV